MNLNNPTKLRIIEDAPSSITRIYLDEKEIENVFSYSLSADAEDRITRLTITLAVEAEVSSNSMPVLRQLPKKLSWIEELERKARLALQSWKNKEKSKFSKERR